MSKLSLDPTADSEPVRLTVLVRAKRTRVSRASPLPPSGDRSKAEIVMPIVIAALTEKMRPRSKKFFRACRKRRARFDQG